MNWNIFSVCAAYKRLKNSKLVTFSTMISLYILHKINIEMTFIKQQIHIIIFFNWNLSPCEDRLCSIPVFGMFSTAGFQGSVVPSPSLVSSQTISSPKSHLDSLVTTVPIKMEPSQPVYPTTAMAVSTSGWTPSVSPGPATNNSNSSHESDSKDPPSVSPITVSLSQVYFIHMTVSLSQVYFKLSL